MSQIQVVVTEEGGFVKEDLIITFDELALDVLMNL
jgi:hypothetical protein